MPAPPSSTAERRPVDFVYSCLGGKEPERVEAEGATGPCAPGSRTASGCAARAAICTGRVHRPIRPEAHLNALQLGEDLRQTQIRHPGRGLLRPGRLRIRHPVRRRTHPRSLGRRRRGRPRRSRRPAHAPPAQSRRIDAQPCPGRHSARRHGRHRKPGSRGGSAGCGGAAPQPVVRPGMPGHLAPAAPGDAHRLASPARKGRRCDSRVSGCSSGMKWPHSGISAPVTSSP